MMDINKNPLAPRRRASSEIKLLRLDLYAESFSPCEGIGIEWNPEQPAENLSPQKAAEHLGIEEWTPASLVQKRFRVLQLRYPPEQFQEKHLDWLPSAELLGNPVMHLNWYWKSGLIPNFHSEKPSSSDSLWDSSSIDQPIDPLIVINRLLVFRKK